MKNTLLICAVALAAYGCASTPADPAAATEPTAATTAPVEQVATPASDSKLVCETVANTGSRLGSRQCKTPAQIEADKQNAKDATNVIQRDGLYQVKKGG
jgi:hypothetical protein